MRPIFYFITFLSACLLLFNPSKTIAQSNNGWTVTPFESKHFIKNNGQFDSRVKAFSIPSSSLISTESNAVSVKYGLDMNGVEIYFTTTGILYRRDKIEQLEEEEKEELFRKANKNREEYEEYEREAEWSVKRTPQFLEMQWLGANPAAEIIADGMESAHHTYYIDNVSIRANSYKKLTYKNLYPNIDVEYYFPEDKEGFKYNIILHPGAEVASIQQIYKGAEEIKQDLTGNTVINSMFGDFVDHAPIAFLENGEEVDCSFNLEKNIITFDLGIDKIQQKVVIDPWVETPDFPINQDVYEIDRDSLDNIYVFGSFRDQIVQKYDSNGILQWTYDHPYLDFSDEGVPQTPWFGDFAVHPGGNVYITSLFDFPTEVNGEDGSRISPIYDRDDFDTSSFLFGLQVTSFKEPWRCVFNCDYSKLFIVLGLTESGMTIVDLEEEWNSPSSLSSKETFPNLAEVRSLTRGVKGNIYGIVVGDETKRQAEENDTSMQNYLIALDPLLDTLYSVPINTNLSYQGRQYNYWAGQNAISTNSKFFYVADGKRIFKGDIDNGKIIDSVLVTPGIAEKNAGIAADECGNIYYGSQIGVIKYDSLFNVIAIDTTPGAVYDVTIGNNGKVYASGAGFIKQTNLSICNADNIICPCMTASNNLESCDTLSNGSATIEVKGDGGPFTYEWNTGDTTPEVNNLEPGEYSVEIRSAGGCIVKKTYVIDSFIDLYSCNCFGFSTIPTCDSGASIGSISILENSTLGRGFSLPFTYTWSTGDVVTAPSTLSNLNSETYSVEIRDSRGCKVSGEVTVGTRFKGSSSLLDPLSSCSNESDGGVAISIDFDSLTSLFGDGGELAISAFPIQFLWGNGDTSTLTSIADAFNNNFNTYRALTPGKHSVIIKDALGCIIKDSIEVSDGEESGNLTLELLSGFNTNCEHIVEAAITGGSGNYTYQWSNGNTTRSLTVNTVTTELGVFVTDESLDCIAVDSINLSGNVWRVDSVELNNIFCEEVNTGAITLDILGNDFSQLDIRWLNNISQNIANDSTQLSNLPEGDYQVSISDEFGCLDTTLQLNLQRISSDAFIDIKDTVLCYGDSLLLSVTGIEEYEWFEEGVKIGENSSVLIKPERLTRYWVTGEKRSCILEDTILIGICGPEVYIFIPNVFTPNQDGENDFLQVFSNLPLYQMEISIYDRFGKLLFTGNSLFDKWDGTWKGKPLNEGVYVYTFTGKQTEKSEEIRKTGNITLIR